ncbi:dephospho-CoA kinase [Pseudooceanicola sp. CBS1P-1]|uniref:Dephospho-CoA kinase n=1 Tax=Pseudooceanicola albus TaxID=2692189 RepID=A0A6L7FYK0_9RHOB|nr:MULTISPECIES: dephospho-CoA kinase [Pseudooceanicola]MBT9385715.1 dephospho-CoA kinase [Pseudooceanicola endophyticus]MXN16749.1 dephospho-CoA kinase [Pseudooceanicola albus]
MSFLLGLTGSVGMGKSTTLKMFAEAGCDVWDADSAVHRLYGPGGAAVAPMKAAFPEAVRDGIVSRETLKRMIADDPSILRKIEQIVHPLVAEDRRIFIERAKSDVAVCDIPLLYENGYEGIFDAVAVVSTDPETQKSRVMARGTMTEDQFELILKKQLPDAGKRARASYVIETRTLPYVREQVAQILEEIRKGQIHA